MRQEPELHDLAAGLLFFAALFMLWLLYAITTGGSR